MCPQRLHAKIYDIEEARCEVEEYNFYKRLFQVKKLLADNPAIEDPCQRMNYSYGQAPAARVG